VHLRCDPPPVRFGESRHVELLVDRRDGIRIGEGLDAVGPEEIDGGEGTAPPDFGEVLYGKGRLPREHEILDRRKKNVGLFIEAFFSRLVPTHSLYCMRLFGKSIPSRKKRWYDFSTP
jgi:hypothetical protein